MNDPIIMIVIALIAGAAGGALTMHFTYGERFRASMRNLDEMKRVLARAMIESAVELQQKVVSGEIKIPHIKIGGENDQRAA